MEKQRQFSIGYFRFAFLAIQNFPFAPRAAGLATHTPRSLPMKRPS